MKTLYIGNDNIVSISGLTNAATNAVVNDATVMLSLSDTSGNAVAGQSFPVAMNYVATSDGDYAFNLQSDLQLRHNTVYVAQITVNSSGIDAAWEFQLKAEKRGLNG
jgi:hypothetical protein